MRSLFVFTLMLLLFASCNNQTSNTGAAGTHMVVVKEVQQGGPNYTYLRVEENGSEQWLAVPSMEAKTGETFYYAGGLKLSNFESKELKRTFETLIMLNEISREPIVATDANTTKQTVTSPHSTAPVLEQADIKIEPAEGGITIAKLFSDKKNYKDKNVIIKGQVIKYNPGIMNRNWVHLQDGTEFEGNYDLTVTTSIEVAVGDVITLEGRISLDKDFGAGYAYDVIMEEAVLK
jgi:hypothetical protein